jgi:hypothetical protein
MPGGDPPMSKRKRNQEVAEDGAGGDVFSLALRVEITPGEGAPSPGEVSRLLGAEPTDVVRAGDDPSGEGEAWERHLWMLAVDGAPGEPLESLASQLTASVSPAGADAWRKLAPHCEAYLWIGVFRTGEEARADLPIALVEFAARLGLPIYVRVMPDDPMDALGGEDDDEAGDDE